MSRENVEFVRKLFGAANVMDKASLLAAVHELVPQAFTEDAEWAEDPQRADQRLWRGHDGICESWETWLAQWDRYSFQISGIEDHGDKVFVAAREEARGVSSGASVAAHNFVVLTFRDGKIARYQEFHDEAAARDELY
jgi:ketosteroid isomerase-like protein